MLFSSLTASILHSKTSSKKTPSHTARWHPEPHHTTSVCTPVNTLPVHSDTVPFPSLPIDIAYLIVQLAAFDHRTALTLSLVSKEVQQWSDVILFRHLSIQTRRSNIFSPVLLDRLFNPEASQRLQRARGYVQSYFAHEGGLLTTQIEQLLLHCPTFREIDLATSAYFLDFKHIFCPTLRLVSCRAFHLDRELASTFCSPLFQSVTNLAIRGAYREGPGWKWLSRAMADMPSLTHLLLSEAGYETGSFTSRHKTVQEDLYELSQVLQPSLKLLVLVMSAEMIEDSATLGPAIRSGSFDDRIVAQVRRPDDHISQEGVILCDGDLYTWQEPFGSLWDVWERGTEIVRRRRMPLLVSAPDVSSTADVPWDDWCLHLTAWADDV